MRRPKVIALIPDGNRRWARRKGVPLREGYEKGIRKLVNFGKWCKEVGIKKIGVWGFSTENFQRPESEKRELFGLFQKLLDEGMDKELEAKLRFRGDLSRFPGALQQRFAELERKSSGELELFILLGYGGRQEILQACQKAKVGVSEKEFMKLLWFPYEPDLIIRTGGAIRTSGFLPFQSAYSEWIFFRKLWPDFTKADFKRALQEYSRRERRFGR